MQSLKKIARYFHRYLGWLSGIVVAVLCATGALLLIQPEVERVAEPERYAVPKHAGDVLSIDDFLVAFEQNEKESFDRPVNLITTRLAIPQNPARPWRVSVSARDLNESWRYVVYVDPFTGKGISYGASKTQDFFRTVRRLHTSLCLNPQIGRPIVGWSTFAFFFVLLTGFIRWLPQRFSNKKAWKSGLIPSFTKGKFRVLYDLHNVFGFYAAGVLAILSFTGCWLAFGWVRDAVDKTIGYDSQNYSQRDFTIDEVSDAAVSFQSIFDSQIEKFGRKGYEISFPGKGSTRPLYISQTGGFFYPDEYCWNPYNGELVGVAKFSDLPLSRRVRYSLSPLHRGIFWGGFTRLLAFLGCVVGVVLVVTGYILTLNRWDREEKAAKKKAELGQFQGKNAAFSEERSSRQDE